MGFPNTTELKRALKKLEKKEGTLDVREGATPLEKFRFDLCQKFIKYKMKYKITQKELAIIVGVDDPKMSKILRHRIDEFSTDRLIELCSKIDPHLKLKVS